MADQQDAQTRQSLIEYPCDFPIKVMGARVDGFAQVVIEVVLRHAPDYARWDHGEAVPRERIRAFAELGVTGLRVPEIYGGVGGSYVMAGIAAEEIARGVVFLTAEAHPSLIAQARSAGASSRLRRTCCTSERKRPGRSRALRSTGVYGFSASASRTLNAARPPVCRYSGKISGVLAKKFGRRYSACSVVVNSVRYSSNSWRVLRQVK